ncbi:P-loop containing nucleoside triphosphate hydrolase protein [Laetiporus sulphureus 93-53]|uniref:RNA helicase n=1 Tax=Laetiporus sulphureus 93-53 TaxID=1314785 RepID=A0A165BBE6_9APHY|nr:P-loop containing nucleoside triphosphate hydrolase protein [Laetiporus sulphureus 93-53]KZT00672.1 P-loop containing nucleoside triphosphate hydrolase protein [Laetiporus sulphureus 93-53]
MVQICTQLLSTGACTLPSCPSSHDVHICRLCGVLCYTSNDYRAHLRGKVHKKKTLGRSVIYHCSICNTNLHAFGWITHVEGKRHKAHAKVQCVDPAVEPEEEATLPGHTFCNVCGINVRQSHWEFHLGSPSHVKKVLFTKYEAAVDEAEKNKHGVDVSHGEDGLDFGVVELQSASTGVRMTLSVSNTVPLEQLILEDVKMSNSSPRRPSTFSLSFPAHPAAIIYGRPLNIEVSFQRHFRGRYEDRIELVLRDTALNKTFIIVRPVRVTVGSKADHDLLKPVAPYIPRKRTRRDPELDVIPGVPPPALRAVPYVTKLPWAEIPKRISAALAQGSLDQQIAFFRDTELPRVLNSANHSRHFKTLLWIEEHRMENDLQIYDIPDAQMRKYNQYYYLSVPGLAEKRPSVLVGDIVLVQPHGADTGRWYEGHVHVVHKEEVGLCFHGSFQGHQPSQLYNVRFKLNRIPLRRQHQALDTAFDPDRVLLPEQAHFVTTAIPSPIGIRAYIYNSLIISNPPQLQAITSISEQPAGSPPFVIFGPPGTGKTITVVECIRQIQRLNPRARILVCAPSNSAADLIASRLSMLSTSEMFRFYAPSRQKNQVPDELLPYSYTSPQSNHFSTPPVGVLKRYRVIVSTCVSASFAHGVGMPRGHFTHIFVDEAGQATEPEVMVAVRTMADNNTNIVLSGDPKQLGPIIRSGVARALGLEKSYLERLMQRQAYDEISGRGLSVIKLVQNFRSHPTILKFPNERFYKGDLQPCGSPTVIDSFLGSPLLVNKKFPVVMHAISGKDDREASSPSFFNIDEVLQVKDYVQRLRSDRYFRITDAQIGVIAPYHAQCMKIRTALRGVADEVKIGSVEEFQGQERQVIIISTVRSSQEFVEYDLRHTLGFVANPRRFNVAVTRAQALLIIIGDSNVLSLDPLWRSFLNYVYENGGWTGDEPSWDTREAVDEAGGYDETIRDSAISDMNDFARRMEMLTLDGMISTDADDDGNVDRPWREVE